MNDYVKDKASPSDQDGDGVRIIEHGNRGSGSALLYKLLALALAACFAFYVLKLWVNRTASDRGSNHSGQSASQISDADDMASTSTVSTTSAAAGINARPHTTRAAQASRDPNDLANYVAPGQTPKMEEVIKRLHEAGIHEGLGAFNPPGTSPPMIGLAVPDDYVLPEGYVRHFQATDDGQRVEPILMFSPDFDFFDSAGQPIAIPDNRVVPSNMAPPGLVIRPIKIPLPLEPGGH